MSEPVIECPREQAEWCVWCWAAGLKKPPVKYYYATQVAAEAQAQRLNKQLGKGSARAGRLRRADNKETDIVWGQHENL